jgi:ABC-type uncharacterized transport system fused permease/ATPase subunit
MPRREDLFLVPQRVYSSMGSLADQVTYPKRLAASERCVCCVSERLSIGRRLPC